MPAAACSSLRFGPDKEGLKVPVVPEAEAACQLRPKVHALRRWGEQEFRPALLEGAILSVTQQGL